jgi:minor histocompatibility antigen H13
VIPGIFVGLCLKYDVDKCVEKKVKNIVEFKLKYFWVAFFGYVGGICLTIFVLLVFEVPQPALLFIVPTCTIPVGLVAIVQHELDSVMKYTTSPVKK